MKIEMVLVICAFTVTSVFGKDIPDDGESIVKPDIPVEMTADTLAELMTDTLVEIMEDIPAVESIVDELNTFQHDVDKIDTLSVEYELMSSMSISCDRIESSNECEKAFEKIKILNGLDNKRPLQIGHWPGVPYGCSVQIGFDDAPHWNTNVNTDSSRGSSGEFSLLCKKGYAYEEIGGNGGLCAKSLHDVKYLVPGKKTGGHIGGKTLNWCRTTCSKSLTCTFFSWRGSTHGNCFLWTGSDCGPAFWQGNGYMTYKKEIRGVARLEEKCRAVSSCKRKLDGVKGDIEKFQSGIGIAGEVAEILGDKKVKRGMTDFSKKLIKLAGKAAPLLSAMGPIGDLLGAFFPSTEEQLLTQILEELEKQFKIVNERFDQVFIQFQNIKDLIKDEHLKTQYKRDKDKIKHASQTMQTFLAAPKSSILGYKTQVKNELGKTAVEFAGYRLAQNLGTEKFTRILMDAENSNRQKVHARMLAQYNLIQQAVKFYLFWLTLKSEDVPSYNKAFQHAERVRWEGILKDTLDKLDAMDRKNFLDSWSTHWKKDLEEQVKKGGSNQDMASRVYSFLRNKYDWLDWNVIVYNPVSGWDQHTVSQCGGTIHFRWYGHNVVVTYIHANKPHYDQTAAKKILNGATTEKRVYCYPYTCGMEPINNAKTTYNSFASKVTDCGKYTIGAVIRSSAHPVVKTAPGRQTIVTKHGVKLILTG